MPREAVSPPWKRPSAPAIDQFARQNIYFLDNEHSGLRVTSQEGLDTLSRTIRSKGHRALVNALIEARMVRGLSQDALAERLGCHQSLIARIESGQRRIDVVELVVLCRALGASPVELLEVTEAATGAQHQIV